MFHQRSPWIQQDRAWRFFHRFSFLIRILCHLLYLLWLKCLSGRIGNDREIRERSNGRARLVCLCLTPPVWPSCVHHGNDDTVESTSLCSLRFIRRWRLVECKGLRWFGWAGFQTWSGFNPLTVMIIGSILYLLIGEGGAWGQQTSLPVWNLPALPSVTRLDKDESKGQSRRWAVPFNPVKSNLCLLCFKTRSVCRQWSHTATDTELRACDVFPVAFSDWFDNFVAFRCFSLLMKLKVCCFFCHLSFHLTSEKQWFWHWCWVARLDL